MSAIRPDSYRMFSSLLLARQRSGEGYIYRPKRSFGQGYIFTGVCDSVHGGGGVCSKFLGVCSKFSGGVSAPNFGGGVCSKFFGGVSVPIFRGGVCSKFWGGCLLQFFRGVCSNFWGGVWSKFSGGGGSPIFGIRSTFGRYASYWNAFLFQLCLSVRHSVHRKRGSLYRARSWSPCAGPCPLPSPPSPDMFKLLQLWTSLYKVP